MYSEFIFVSLDPTTISKTAEYMPWYVTGVINDIRLLWWQNVKRYGNGYRGIDVEHIAGSGR